MSEVRTLLEELQRQGWRVEATRKNHHKAIPPKGGELVYIGQHEEGHALANTLARLRKAGFVWPTRCAEKAAAREAHAERPTRLIRAWKRHLEEARGYLVLAEEQLRERAEQMEKALLAFEEARGEVDAAAAQVASAEQGLAAARAAESPARRRAR